MYIYISISETVGSAQKLHRGVYNGERFVCPSLYMRSERDEKQTKEKKKKNTEKKMKKKDRWRDTRGSNREGFFFMESSNDEGRL